MSACHAFSLFGNDQTVAIHSATFKWHATMMTACHAFSLFGNDQTVAIFDHTHLQTHPKHLGQNGPSQCRMIKKGDVSLPRLLLIWKRSDGSHLSNATSFTIFGMPRLNINTQRFACDVGDVTYHALIPVTSPLAPIPVGARPSTTSHQRCCCTIFKPPDYTAASR